MDGRRVKRKFTISDASSFVDSVKQAFHDEPAKFKEFLKLLKALKVDLESSKASIIELIKGHESLLHGFSFFFPDVEQAIKRNQSEPDWENFLNKLKIRFKTIDTQVVDSFLKFMKMYAEKELSEEKVREKVRDLLYYHEDLIGDFSTILSKHKCFSINISST